MLDAERISLNTLNHDPGEGVLNFSFQGIRGTQLVKLVGTVPIVMPVECDARQVSKDTMRQLLLEAIRSTRWPHR